VDRASWLLKALHEASDQVHEALSRASAPHANDELLAVAWDLVSHERSTGWHLEQMLRSRDRLELHPMEWLTTSDDATDLDALAWDYARVRQGICEMLWGLPPSYLARRAQHPFRGDISLEDLLVSMHERDIETMLALQRITSSARVGRTSA